MKYHENHQRKTMKFHTKIGLLTIADPVPPQSWKPANSFSAFDSVVSSQNSWIQMFDACELWYVCIYTYMNHICMVFHLSIVAYMCKSPHSKQLKLTTMQ